MTPSELRTLLDAATPGPWTVESETVNEREYVTMCITRCARRSDIGADLDLITTLRRLAPHLLRLWEAEVTLAEAWPKRSLEHARQDIRDAIKALEDA